MAAFFMAAFLFGQEGLLGLLQFLLWFCSSSSIAASLDRDLLPAIVNGNLFQPLKINRKAKKKNPRNTVRARLAVGIKSIEVFLLFVYIKIRRRDPMF